MKTQSKILVIRFSAFGDFLLVLNRMKAIRDNNKNAHMTLLTTAPFKEMAEKTNYFDKVVIDPRFKISDFKISKIKNTINNIKYLKKNLRNINIVFDLQKNDRSFIYYNFLFPFRRPKLIGYKIPYKIEKTDFSWLKEDIKKFKLPTKYCLLITGCAKNRPLKRWEAKKYSDLANKILVQGYVPILIGTNDDKEGNDIVKQICPSSINLTNKTTIFEIAEIARGAKFCVTNDTGPGLMSSLIGCKTLFLIFLNSDPIKKLPPGQYVDWIRKEDKKDLSVEEVFIKLKEINYLT